MNCLNYCFEVDGKILIDGLFSRNQSGLEADGILADDNDKTKAFNGTLADYAVVGGKNVELYGWSNAQSNSRYYFHELGGNSQYDNSVRQTAERNQQLPAKRLFLNHGLSYPVLLTS